MKKLLGYGVMLWGFIYAIGSALYPWAVDARPLFIWTLTLAAAVVATIASLLLLRDVRAHALRQGMIAAVTWPLMCLVLDLALLMVVPPRLGAGAYLRELGPMYLVVAVVVLAVGLQRNQLEAHGHRHPRRASSG